MTKSVPEELIGKVLEHPEKLLGKILDEPPFPSKKARGSVPPPPPPKESTPFPELSPINIIQGCSGRIGSPGFHVALAVMQKARIP